MFLVTQPLILLAPSPLFSYSIQAQLVCPQPTQPHILPGSCQYGSVATVYTGTGDQLNGIALGLTPYSTYQFFLIATNSHSAKQSSPSIFYTTRSSGRFSYTKYVYYKKFIIRAKFPI